MYRTADTPLPAALLALLALSLLTLGVPRVASAQSPDASDWGTYGGDQFGTRFSSLAEIDRSNVKSLRPAWIYHTGELGQDLARAGKLTFEATPVLAFGSLYLETATNIVVALDPATGKERWRHDPHVDRRQNYTEATSRGVSVWEDPAPGKSGLCVRRIFTGTL